MRHFLLALLATTALTLPLAAQMSTIPPPDSPDDDSISHFVRRLETVVISATRTPKRADQLPVPVQVISHDQIESSNATSLPQLLQALMPGVELGYAMDQQPTLRLQGFGANSVLFLVDGERLSGETLDNIDYSRLSLDDADRIEVVRGAASALYGSNAIGGVVNLIPRRPSHPWQADINLRADSRLQRSANASFGFLRSHWNGLTSIRAGRAEALPLKPGGDYDTLFAQSTRGLAQRLAYSPSDNLTLSARASYSFRERDNTIVSHDRYRGFSFGSKADYSNDATTAQLAYSFDQYDKSTLTLASAIDALNYRNVQHSLRTICTHQLDSTTALTIGGDFLNDYLLSYQFANGDSHRQLSADAFAQLDWRPTSRLGIIGALRYDYYNASANHRLSPKLSLIYTYPRLTIRAVYGSGFRAPSLKEMYMNFDMAGLFTIIGNPSLRPETSHNLSLSAEWHRNQCLLSAMLYHNRISHRISTAWSPSQHAMLYINNAAATVSGIDLSAANSWDNGLGLKLNYLLCLEHITDRTPSTAITRPHSLNLQSYYTHSFTNSTLSASLSLRLLSALSRQEYISYTDLSQTHLRTYPAYLLCNLSTTYTFSSNGPRLTLGIDNLFNYRYPCYSNATPPTPGRTLSLSLSWRFTPSSTPQP